MSIRRGGGWAEVERVAERQQWTIHRAQILAAGIIPRAIPRYVERRELHPLFRDVFLVGWPNLEPLSRPFAALLHFKGDAILGHLIAGYLWRILDELPEEIEVTLVGRAAAPQPGVVIHRVPSLHPDDHALRHGLDVTSPARTLVDLAGCVSVVELESALAIALRRRLTTRAEIDVAIARAPGRKGAAALRAVLAQGGSPADTRSRYERTLLGWFRQAGLPTPETNVMFEGYLVDFLWRELRVVGEMDGFRFHGSRAQFEIDRERGARLVAANCRLVRVTARQIDRTPLTVVAWFAAAIALARAGALVRPDIVAHPDAAARTTRTPPPERPGLS